MVEGSTGSSGGVWRSVRAEGFADESRFGETFSRFLQELDRNQEAENSQGGDTSLSFIGEGLAHDLSEVPDEGYVGAVLGRAGLAADLGRPASSSVLALPSSSADGPSSGAGSRDAETQTEPCLGVCYGPLDALMSQNWAITMTEAAVKFVLVLAYTFDLEPLADALIRAKQRGVRVEIGVDRRFRRSKTCKNMLGVLLKLRSYGIRMRDLSGGSLAAAYAEVGRSSNSGLRGQQHSKVVLTESTLLCGSCNFTAASRGNLECGTMIQLSEHGKREAEAMIQGRLDGGEEMGTD